MQSSEITELASKIGVKFVTYKSSPLKGSPSPFEKTTPLTDQVIQSSVKDIYDFFSEMVKERRGEKLTAKNLSKILDGRIFTGRQALQNGLIDQIGGKKEALNYLSEKKQIDVEEYQVRKIDLEKKENALLSKFVGEATLSKIIGKITNGFGINSNQLMSVWTLN
jgi:protease-4